MSINIESIIGKPESQTLEYKAVLPPSKNIAQLISSFSNAEGGYIILGVSEDLKTVGLSSDFRATSIIHKAIDLLLPKPQVEHKYITYKGKNLYLIQVKKSNTPISLEGKVFKRVGTFNNLENPIEIVFKPTGSQKLLETNDLLSTYKENATSAKIKFIEHYQSILKIMDDLSNILYPEGQELATNNQEGKTLMRILFSSLADNFETYLSDLLYEIFLAKPETLKSEKTVTIKEVLNCSDLQEFVHYWANKQIGKLQKGSVKGFIEENIQIKKLNVVDKKTQEDIERILQIRHLYSHRNGIVDEKFLQYFSGQFDLNSEHNMSINEVLDKLAFLSKVVNQVDNSAISKYSLAKTTIG